MFFRILAGLFCALLSIGVCSAQDNLTGSISLREAINATMMANPQLRSFPLLQQALIGERISAQLKPSLRFNASIDNALGNGTLTGINGAEATLSLSQVVEMGDQRASRVGTTNRRLELLDAEHRVTQLNLIAEVTFRYIELTATQQRVALQAETAELARQTVELLTPLVRAGQTPQLELIRARATYIREQMAERSSYTDLENAKIRLSSMWANHNPKFDSTNADLLSVGVAQDLTSILLEVSLNPNIAIYASEERLLQAQLREARSQRQNDIEWSAGIRHLQEIDDTGFVFNVSVPLFNNQRQSGAIKTAQANVAEVEARRETALNSMQTQLHSLHRQLIQAIDEVNTLQQDVLPLLRETLALTRDVYQSGRYSYLELISAQDEYLDAELALINSAANAHTLRTEIERLSGASLSDQ